MNLTKEQSESIKKVTGYAFKDLQTMNPREVIGLMSKLLSEHKISTAQNKWLLDNLLPKDNTLELIVSAFDGEVIEEPKEPAQIPLVIKDKLTIRERILVIMSRHQDFVEKFALQKELKGYELHSEETFARCMRKLAEDVILESKLINGLVAYKLVQ